MEDAWNHQLLSMQEVGLMVLDQTLYTNEEINMFESNEAIV
jgi:hypothetical protein